MTTLSRYRPSVVIAVSIVLHHVAVAEEPTAIMWPQFRGVNGSGVAVESQAIPLEFGPNTNVRWKVDLPSGHSSPCVWDNSVFITSYDDGSKKLEVWCIDRRAGGVRWRRHVPTAEIERGHPAFDPASSTPATDGQRVVVYFGSAGLICFDFSGNEQWRLPLPVARTFAGNAISPIIADGKVILYRATYDDHYLLAVSVETGEQVWKHEFPLRLPPWASCTGTPIVHKNRLIIHCLSGVRAHNLADGDPVWWVRAATTATSSPVIGADHVFVATWLQTGEPALVPTLPGFDELLLSHDKDEDGQLARHEMPTGLVYFNRPEGIDGPQSSRPIRFQEVDRNKNGRVDEGEWETLRGHMEQQRSGTRQHGLLAIRLGGQGDVTESHMRVLERQSIPEVPSPIVYDGRVLMVKNGGILTCIDAAAGERLYRTRVGTSGTHYASPVMIGSKLIVASGPGQVAIVDVSGKRARTVSENDFGEAIFATPAIVDDMLLVRTERRLYAVAKP